MPTAKRRYIHNVINVEMSERRNLYSCYFLAVMLAMPLEASANVGIPMIIVTLPGMLALLLPVVLIETFVAYKKLNLGFGRAFRIFGIANLQSTIVGLPVAWLKYVIFEIVIIIIIASFATIFPENISFSDNSVLELFGTVVALFITAPWPFPGRNLSFVPTATLILLVPAYWISWRMESCVVCKYLSRPDDQYIISTVRSANRASYTFLAIVVTALLFLM